MFCSVLLFKATLPSQPTPVKKLKTSSTCSYLGTGNFVLARVLQIVFVVIQYSYL